MGMAQEACAGEKPEMRRPHWSIGTDEMPSLICKHRLNEHWIIEMSAGLRAGDTVRSAGGASTRWQRSRFETGRVWATRREDNPSLRGREGAEDGAWLTIAAS